MSDFGTYITDTGPAHAIGIRDTGNGTDTIGVFSDGHHGSGLSVGFTVLEGVVRGDAVGNWTPPAKPAKPAPAPEPAKAPAKPAAKDAGHAHTGHAHAAHSVTHKKDN